MDETISADSRDFETNVDLAPNRSLPEPAAILVERLARRHYKIPEELASRLDKASRNEGVEASSFLLAAFTVVLNRYVHADSSEKAYAAQTFGDLARSFSDDTSVHFDDKCIDREVTLSDFPKALGTSTASRGKALLTWSVSDHFVSQDVDLHFRCRGLRGNDSELQVVIDIAYRESWWTQDWIDRMFGHLVTVLSVATLDADTPIADICILTEQERTELLVGFNDTAKDYPRDVCVHELFEQQVQRTPDAVALVFEDQQLTYAELNARANRLARYLRSKGVGIETPVGMCLERSLDLVVSILGILKAGATYVPLDAEYPKERTLHMIENSKVYAILTQRSVLDRISYLPNPLCVEQIQDASNGLMETAESIPKVPVESIAYVIHTSGSTGIPKGVAVSQSSLVNLLSWANGVLFTDVETALMGVAPATFDISLAEFLAPLLAGKTTVLTSKDTARDPVTLTEQIAIQNHCVVQVTPATWISILDSKWDGRGCKTAISTGEALPASVRSKLLKLGLRVLDLYGPTETTIWSTYREVRMTDNYSCIGRPIANTQVYVLDTHQQLVPIGIPGELYIGGDGLARGYLNRSDLTAERFVSNPFSQDPQSRLYRTGDLCRLRADGNIEYLGRIDHQVKLRGFRIELGEIESTLASHPAIAQCVVILREDRPGDKRLVAYYTASGVILPSISQLREHLETSLPEYMIPSAFVHLDALPLTPSGKIDRRGLPAPDLKDIDAQDQYTPARNGIEEQLVEIWQEILGIERIGVHDNFFALGGHSLMAARLIVTIRDRLGLNLPFKILFANPTIAKTASRISELDAQSETESQPEDQADDGIDWTLDRIPASYAQRSLYLIDQMFDRQSAYNIPLAWQIDGQLNVEALRESILRVVQNHEPLRTIYGEDSQGIWQEVRSVDSWELPILNLTHEPIDQRLQNASAWMDQQGQNEFDLKSDLPIRSTLIQISESSHILFLVFHHIAIDGWSTENFKRELGNTYDQILRGGLELPSTPKKSVPLVRYRDYTRAQLRYSQSDSIQRDRLYWKDQLSGSRDLELPTDFKRPNEFTFRGDYVDMELSVELCEQIDLFCKDHDCTPHALLLTVFQLLLATQSRQEDILTAVPVGARNNAQWEDLLGYFINITPIRSQIDPADSFATHAQRVQSTSALAYDHRGVPFELVVSDVCPEISSDRNPLVQSLFQLFDFESQELRLGSLGVTAIERPLPGSRFDLEMNLYRNRDGETGKSFIQGYLYYCSDLWEKSTVVSWAKRFTTWLDQFLKSPQMPIASVELMSKDELSELIQLESGKLIAGHLEKTVIELFDQQAHNRLSSIALSDGNHSMTYEELRVRSCQIAFCLLERGITVGSRVAVLMDRSFDSIATLLGIWKAGGVYLPLDPSYPKGRLKYFIQDAQPLALICTKELIGTIDFPTERTLVLEPQTKLSCRENLDEIAFPRVGLEDQAYLLYTSGSTGEPKGVQMPHRALANLIGWQKTQERLSSAAKTLQFAPRCFDVSLQEIASTLTVGGTLVLIDESQRLDPHSLVDFIETNHIERVFLPYVMIDALVAVASPRQLTRLRDIVSAGESLRLSSRLRDFLSTHPDCILHNHYGPTETHVVTESIIQLDSFDLTAEAHIGRPLPNCTCVILDENRKRVHRGAIGELFISGACLATGYANKPQMTTERFTIRNDLGGFNSTWYRTGDLARWRYDGNLDFLGRGDHQVKLRGFRIELGEIESNLASHPAIAQSVVILREDRPGDKRLVAYYTASGEILPSIAQLREHLQTSLPEYMIPSAFVHLDALPLTPSGKIDRRGLPAPDLKDIDAQDQYTPARNGIEEQLVEIWQEILGMERIGVHDNFFALGGHSLLAVRLTSRVSDVFEAQLGVRQVFENPSIARQALQIEAMRSGGQKDKPIQLVRTAHEVGSSAPLSHAQERLWFLEQLEGSLTAYNLPMSWRIRGTLDTQALRKSLEAIVLRHEPLRTTFKHDGTLPVQIIQRLDRFELPTLDLRELEPQIKAQQIQQVVLSEANGAFDLKCDLMIRARLLRLEDHEHELLVTMHHIASDGWSIDVLSRELSRLYRHFLDTPDSPTDDVTGLLEPLAVNYIDYTLWQRENLSKHRIEGLLEYWREELNDLPALELPTDRPRPSTASYQGSSVEVKLPEGLISKLEALCSSEQVTLQMLLLAAFESLLYRYSHQEDFAVGIPFAGREDSQLEELIGFFVSTLVIRADLSGEPTFHELLARVRQKSLAAYDHQSLPLQMLLADLQPERHLSRPPLFQVMFQLLSRNEAGLTLQGLEVTDEDHGSNRVKFDLELHLSRHTGDIRFLPSKSDPNCSLVSIIRRRITQETCVSMNSLSSRSKGRPMR